MFEVEEDFVDVALLLLDFFVQDFDAGVLCCPVLEFLELLFLFSLVLLVEFSSFFIKILVKKFQIFRKRLILSFLMILSFGSYSFWKRI